MAKEAKTPSIEQIERAFDAVDAAEGVDRSEITRDAQQEAQRAVELVGAAMEADEEAAEAKRLSIISTRVGSKENSKKARSREREARKAAKAQHKEATKSAKKAYNAIRFSDPNKLGFLRVIQVMLMGNIIFTVFALTTYIKGSYTIEFNEILNLVNVMLDGVTFWLIWKRKKFARTWVIAVSSFNIIVGTVFNMGAGSFDVLGQVALSAFDLFMLIYFVLSKRVEASLVEPFNQRTLNEDLDEEESFFRPKTWEFWRNLAIYYVIFSIVGHWIEAAVCLLIKYGIVPGVYDPTSQIWSDWLYPFPVYGIGFCACALLLYPLKNFLQRKVGPKGGALALSYVANGLVCTIIEFVMGLAVNADLQLWDYSTMFCNFMGQVCLQNALFFGFLATVMTWLVYPALERLFRRIPNEYMTVVFVLVLVGCAILYALYYINLPVNEISGAVAQSGGASAASSASASEAASAASASASSAASAASA